MSKKNNKRGLFRKRREENDNEPNKKGLEKNDPQEYFDEVEDEYDHEKEREDYEYNRSNNLSYSTKFDDGEINSGNPQLSEKSFSGKDKIGFYERLSRTTTGFVNPFVQIEGTNIIVSDSMVAYCYTYTPLATGFDLKETNANILKQAILNVAMPFDFNFISTNINLSDQLDLTLDNIRKNHTSMERKNIYTQRALNFFQKKSGSDGLSDGYGLLIFLENRKLTAREGKKRKRSSFDIRASLNAMTEESIDNLLPEMITKDLEIRRSLALTGASFNPATSMEILNTAIRYEVPTPNLRSIVPDGYVSWKTTQNGYTNELLYEKMDHNNSKILEKSYFSYLRVESIDNDKLDEPNDFLENLILNPNANTSVFISAEIKYSDEILPYIELKEEDMQVQGDRIKEKMIKGEETFYSEEADLKLADIGEELKEELIKSEASLLTTMVIRLESENHSHLLKLIESVEKSAPLFGVNLSRCEHEQYIVHENISPLRENNLKTNLISIERFANLNFWLGSF